MTSATSNITANVTRYSRSETAKAEVRRDKEKVKGGHTEHGSHDGERRGGHRA